MIENLKQWLRWRFDPKVYNCNCKAPVKGEKLHRKNCASWKNASPNKRPVA